MDMVTRVQITNKSVCISHNTNTLEKGVNLTILPPTIENEFIELCLKINFV